MLALENIAVLIDETPEAGLHLADRLAAPTNATVHLFSMKRPSVAARDEAADKVTVGHGIPGRQLLEFLEEKRIDLAIMSHSSIHWWTSLVHRDIVGEASRRSTTPILALGDEAMADTIAARGIRTALVAATCEADVFAAMEIGAAVGEPGLHLIFGRGEMLDFDLDAILETVRAPTGVRISTLTVDGPLVAGLVTRAAAIDADMFVVGARPHDDLVDRLFGTTADRMLELAGRLPVLVIPRVRARAARTDYQLDEALATSMPASDPLPLP